MWETKDQVTSINSILEVFFNEPKTLSRLLNYEDIKEYVSDQQIQQIRNRNFGTLKYSDNLTWHNELKLIEPVDYWSSIVLKEFEKNDVEDLDSFVQEYLYQSNGLIEEMRHQLRVSVDILVVTHDLFNQDDKSYGRYAEHNTDGSYDNFSYNDREKLERILTRNYDNVGFIEYLITDGNDETDEAIHQAKLDFLRENGFPENTNSSLLDWKLNINKISSMTKISVLMFRRYFDKMVGRGSVEDLIQKISFNYGKRLDYEFYVEHFRGNFEILAETDMTSAEYRSEYSNDNPLFVGSADDNDEADAKKYFEKALRNLYSEKEIRNYIKDTKNADIIEYIKELSEEYLMEHEAEERTIYLDYSLEEKINWYEVSEIVYSFYKKEIIDDLESPMKTYKEYVMDFYYKNRELDIYLDNFMSYFTVILKER